MFESEARLEHHGPKTQTIRFVHCVVMFQVKPLIWVESVIERHAHSRVEYMIKVNRTHFLTLKVLVATIDAQWEGMGDVESARYKPALLPPCPTIRVLSYCNCQRSTYSISK